MKLWLAYLVQVGIAADQLINALIPPITGTLSYSDETLSARCYRANRDGRMWGRVMMPVIDVLFLWQTDSHCYMAYLKEIERRGLPPEYRNDALKDAP